MSQQDHTSSNQDLLASRRVAVVQQESINQAQLVGRQSVLRYQDAGVISSHQLALLQRLLPRTRVERLLGSIWFQRRLDIALAVSREELQQLLRIASSDRDDWLQQLGDCINLADPQRLWHSVLYPLHRWWVQRLEPLYSVWLNELDQLHVMQSQLNALSKFWQTGLYMPSDLESRIVEQLATLREREQKLEQLQAQCQARLQQAWLAWYAELGSQVTIESLQPVPLELESFWKALQALPHDVSAAGTLHELLVARGIALAKDHFYWHPPCPR
ncbi:T3SS regulon anti-activator ExsD domain-containing protein [Aeromonas salmonicida]|uniref:T3SS regulon anti-activator ExsD domain-containing protein n=1 Tax=Aeromonas salmonicida TaxID=645 RepID=UPI00232FE9C7|nr:T3SS regulon anti-activator ExsD domain-containing protein [Aeromonas salmonicida]WCH23590.1 T3SS regulon anti-activator ExsD family protein [Aeromonas salmonicida]